MARAKEILQKELLELAPAERAEVAEEAIRSLADTTYGEPSPAWSKRSNAARRNSTKAAPI
jgi:hypothetical protein